MTRAALLLVLSACALDESVTVRGEMALDCGSREPFRLPPSAIASGYVCTIDVCEEAAMSYIGRDWFPPLCQPTEGVEKWIEIRWLDVRGDVR